MEKHWDDRWCRSVLLQKKAWSSRSFSLIFDRQSADFLPGQFTQLGLEIEGTSVVRSFSLANAPAEPLEIYATQIPEGRFSPRLARLVPGDEVWVHRRASGHFTLGAQRACRTLLLCSVGTGLSPYLSMLRHGIPQGVERIVLIQGWRSPESLAYQPLLSRLLELYAGRFEVRLVFSRHEPDPKDCFFPPLGIKERAFSGRIPELFASGCLEEDLGITLEADRDLVCLCGLSEFVKEMRRWLQKFRGFLRASSEASGGYLAEAYG